MPPCQTGLVTMRHPPKRAATRSRPIVTVPLVRRPRGGRARPEPRRDPERPSARHRRTLPAFMAASVAAGARDRERHPAGPRDVVGDGASLRCRRPARAPVSFGCLSGCPIQASHPSGMSEVSDCWARASTGLRQAFATIPAIHIFPVDRKQTSMPKQKPRRRDGARGLYEASACCR